MALLELAPVCDGGGDEHSNSVALVDGSRILPHMQRLLYAPSGK